MRTLLANRGHSFRELQDTLSRAIPNVISVGFCPTRSENHAHAAVQDIIDKLRRSRRPSFLSHLEARRASRGARQSAVGDQVLRRIPRLCSTSRWHSSRTHPTDCRRASHAEHSLSLDDRISLVVEMGAESSVTPRPPSSTPPPSTQCASCDVGDANPSPPPPPSSRKSNLCSQSTSINSMKSRSSSSYAQLVT